MNSEMTPDREQAVGIFLAAVRRALDAIPPAYTNLVSPVDSIRKATLRDARDHFESLPGAIRAKIMDDATSAAQKQKSDVIESVMSKSDEFTLDDIFPKF